MTDELKENSYVYQVALHMKETGDRIEKKADRIETKLDTNTAVTTELDKKQAIANGRTGKLEETTNEMKKTMEILAKAIENNKDSIKTLYIRSITAIIVVSACLATIGYFFQANIKYYNENLLREQQEDTIGKVADKVVSTIELKYDLSIK